MSSRQSRSTLAILALVLASMTLFYGIQRAVILYGDATVAALQRLLGASSTQPEIMPSELVTLANGDAYRIANAAPDAPLVILFSAHREFSFDTRHMQITQHFRQAGFAIASLDVPCHGEDRSAREMAMDNALVCLRKRSERGERYQEQIARATSRVLDDIARRGSAATHKVTVAGVSRGAYVGIWTALQDERISSIVALAPVVDMRDLSEFAGYQGSSRDVGFDGHYEQLAGKNIFVQVSNRDDRINTASVLEFVRKTSYARPESAPVNLVLNVSSERGHREAAHATAAQWSLAQFRQASRP